MSQGHALLKIMLDQGVSEQCADATDSIWRTQYLQKPLSCWSVAKVKFILGLVDRRRSVSEQGRPTAGYGSDDF